MQTRYFLDTREVQRLRKLIAQADATKIVDATRGHRLPIDLPTQEVYVAYTPVAGIPAITRSSGTGTGLNYDTPGRAYCDIYKLIPEFATGTGTTARIKKLVNTGFTELVYNLSQDIIIGDQWITVARDKYGDWFALGSGSSGSSGASSGPVAWVQCGSAFGGNLYNGTLMHDPNGQANFVATNVGVFLGKAMEMDLTPGFLYPAVDSGRNAATSPGTARLYYAIGGWVKDLRAGSCVSSNQVQIPYDTH